MKLITETIENVDVIEEAVDSTGKKSLFIEGVFLQAGVKNRNGRIYPPEILSREVNRYVTENINPGRAYGELGHPAGPTINLDRVSHMIKSIKQEGNNFIGKAKILDTPMGNIVRNLIAEGAQLGVSSRGMGTLKMNSQGINEVQNDFHIATAADIVADPSAPDAFVNGIMESKEWVWSNGQFIPAKLEEIREDIETAARSRQLTEQAKFKAFTKFIQNISNSQSYK